MSPSSANDSFEQHEIHQSFAHPTSSHARLVLIVHISSALWDVAATAPEVLLKKSLDQLRNASLPTEYRLTVAQLWPRRRNLVFDQIKTAPKFEIAHLLQDQPVTTVRFHRQSTTQQEVGEFLRTDINSQVARCYNLHGWTTYPPFINDYTRSSPPSFANPRNLSLL